MKEIKLMLVLGLIGISNLVHSQSKKLVLDIRFQDQFNKDTIELSINGSLIFKNVVLKSDLSTGITSTTVKVYRSSNKALQVEYHKHITNITPTNVLDLCIVMKKRKTCLKVNPYKGIYIGLSKKPSALFDLIQQKLPFMYD